MSISTTAYSAATSAWALEAHSAGIRQQLIRCVPAQELARLHSGVVQTHIPGGDMSERDVCCRVYGEVTVPRLFFDNSDENATENITAQQNASSESFQIPNKDEENSTTEITVLNPDAMEADCEVRVLRGDARVESSGELHFTSGETEKTVRVILG